MVRLILFIQVCAGEERGGLAAHGGNFSSRLVYFKDSNSLLLVMVRCPEDDFSSEHRSERPAPVEQSPPESLSPLFFPPKQCEPLLKTSQPEAQSIKTKTVAVIGAGVAGVSQDPEPLPLTKQSLAEGLRPRLEDARPV